MWVRAVGVRCLALRVFLLGLVADAIMLQECAVDKASMLQIQRLETSPELLRIKEPFEVHATLAATGSVALSDLRGIVKVRFCHRMSDCMEVLHFDEPLCQLLNLQGADCGTLADGDVLELSNGWTIPWNLFRGAYTVQLELVESATSKSVSCYQADGVMIAWHYWYNAMRDYRDAFVAFAVASSSSFILGSYIASFSGGLCPRITGFLFMGILVGPYVTNLVTAYHIALIGKLINRISLSFIAGVAGAEIFYDDFKILLKPILLQVALVSLSTLVLCIGGLFILAATEWVAIPVITMQTNFGAKLAVILLASSLMTARSPASAIAVIKELECEKLTASKIVIGMTVLGDVVVMILFALCCSMARVATEGGAFGLDVIAKVGLQLLVSALLGVAAGMLLRCVIPPEVPLRDHHPMEPSDVHNDQDSASDSKDSGCASYVVMARGAVIIAILYLTAYAADHGKIWAGGLSLEPMLTCTIASCLCGNDKTRRHGLEEGLTMWVPKILLPFFTLAGASLQLSQLTLVFPAAFTIVALRTVGILVGSVSAGALTRTRYPAVRMTGAEVRNMWLTMLAQAGVTLGLVLEVQEDFKEWGQQFGALVIGVIVLNQLVGPVCCRVGLNRIIAARVKADNGDVSGSEESSSEESLTIPSSRKISTDEEQKVSGLTAAFNRLTVLTRKKTLGAYMDL